MLAAARLTLCGCTAAARRVCASICALRSFSLCNSAIFFAMRSTNSSWLSSGALAGAAFAAGVVVGLLFFSFNVPSLFSSALILLGRESGVIGLLGMVSSAAYSAELTSIAPQKAHTHESSEINSTEKVLRMMLDK